MKKPKKFCNVVFGTPVMLVGDILSIIKKMLRGFRRQRPTVQYNYSPSPEDLDRLHEYCVKKRAEKEAVSSPKATSADEATRRQQVANAMAIITTAASEPNDMFNEALEQYVAGNITLEELERNVNNGVYLVEQKTENEKE